jgi:hypothetical protein
MTLERAIRMPKSIPTAAELRALLREYGLRRWRGAQMMRVSETSMARYLLPPTSKNAKRIPQIRWDIMMVEIAKLD